MDINTTDSHLQKVIDWLCIRTSYKPTSKILNYPFNMMRARQARAEKAASLCDVVMKGSRGPPAGGISHFYLVYIIYSHANLLPAKTHDD